MERFIMGALTSLPDGMVRPPLIQEITFTTINYAEDILYLIIIFKRRRGTPCRVLRQKADPGGTILITHREVCLTESAPSTLLHPEKHSASNFKGRAVLGVKIERGLLGKGSCTTQEGFYLYQFVYRSWGTYRTFTSSFRGFGGK